MPLRCSDAHSKIINCWRKLDVIYILYILIILMEEIDKGALVQQRIKKMLENKKKSQLKETGDSTKRLKSGNGDKMLRED